MYRFQLILITATFSNIVWFQKISIPPPWREFPVPSVVGIWIWWWVYAWIRFARFRCDLASAQESSLKGFFTINSCNFLFFVLKCRFLSEFSSTDDAKTGDKEVLNNT